MMMPRERLDAAFALKEPDRTPILGGWIACPQHIMALGGVDEETYWADPVRVSIEAYRKLGSDGLIDVFVPRGREDFRCVDRETYQHAGSGKSLAQVIEEIDGYPSAEEQERSFDFEAEYARFSADLRRMQALCRAPEAGGPHDAAPRRDEMVWMPAQWTASARVTWYSEFGYENFFCVVGLYPDRARKLMEIGGAAARCRTRLIARAVTEGLYPRAVLLGEDICTQRGPMISPDFMERHYMPQLAYALQPLLEVGCRPVWHSDGDVRPLMDMLIEAGVQGFQGFQPECGMTIEMVARKRTRDGEPLLIFGPLAVTTELPFCSPQEIRDKVRRAVEVCRGRASLVLFTSNTINPDVPLENIIAMHEAVWESAQGA
jgi:hypothetical protein